MNGEFKEKNTYMKFLEDLDIPSNYKEKILHILKILYGLKQAIR